MPIATLSDVYRIALSLPETSVDEGQQSISVMSKGKRRGMAWAWRERVHPEKARVPNPAVIAVRVRNLAEKEMLLATNPGALFTEPHYNGFPAVLVRLEAIEPDRLELLITNAWRCLAPAQLVREFDEESG